MKYPDSRLNVSFSTACVVRSQFKSLYNISTLLFSNVFYSTLNQLHVFLNINWAAPCENVSSGICGQRRPRSACASAQSDQGLRFPQTESVDTIECMNREQRPGWYFAHA